MKNILLKLDKLKISVSEVLPADQMTDAEIQLGGAYDGISIQIGGGYYYVGREMEDGSFLHIEGKENLLKELTEALNEKETA